MPVLSRADFLILNTTGPGLLTRTLAESPDLSRMVTVLFPEDVCDLKSWNCFGSLGIHLMDGSWRPSGSFVRRRFKQLLEVWKMDRLVAESRMLGKTRAHVGPRIGAPRASE
jgi:hypothetical protein